MKILRTRFFNFDRGLNKDYTTDRFKDIKQINDKKSVILLRLLDRNIIKREEYYCQRQWGRHAIKAFKINHN